jgi:hypothetical protein
MVKKPPPPMGKTTRAKRDPDLDLVGGVGG